MKYGATGDEEKFLRDQRLDRRRRFSDPVVSGGVGSGKRRLIRPTQMHEHILEPRAAEWRNGVYWSDDFPCSADVRA